VSAIARADSAPRSLVVRARSLVVTVGLVVLVAFLLPVWFVHDRWSAWRSVRRRGGHEAIRRVDAAAVTIDELIAAGRPVVVEGLAATLGIADAATPASLRRRAGDVEFDLKLHDSAAPYFLYSGGYGAEVTARRRVGLDGLFELLDGGLPADSISYQLFDDRSLDGRIAAELAEFDRAISAVSSHRTEPRFSGIWIGARGVVTPLHHDAWPGLLFQTHGTKRVAMYAPGDRGNLYLRPPYRGQGRWSELPGRSANADPAQFPRLDRTVRFETVLTPGDALYVPPFWAHEMEGLEMNISVPFRFATRRRDYLDPGFLRPAAEMLRARLVA
jgi:hypothetical protein